MIDIHNHILFEIDDGSRSLEESLEMIKEEIKQGVNTIVLTPHFNPAKDNLETFISTREKNVIQLKSAVIKEGLDVEILTGSEIYFSTDLFDCDFQKLVLEGTDYILIEFSTSNLPVNILQQISRLTNLGVIPIIAHVERYQFLKENLELMVQLIEQGAILQINAESFIDKKQRSFIKNCFKHNLVHLVATDAHRIDKRQPNLEEAYSIIKKDFGIRFASYLDDNAKEILANNELDVYRPSKIKKILGFYF